MGLIGKLATAVRTIKGDDEQLFFSRNRRSED